jgi:hypothetical protein
MTGGVTDSKSAIRLLHYAALGLAIVASEAEASREDGLGEADGVRLVPNDVDAWCSALSELVRDARERRRRGTQAGAALLRSHTLAAQADERWRALADAVATAPRLADVPILDLREAAAQGRALVGPKLLAAASLYGEGIEIGALHDPVAVPAGVQVRRVDRLDHHGPREHRREPRSAAFPVEPIDAGEVGVLGAESQDFVVANDWLEQRGDPLPTLESYMRVVRPGGTVFMTVPDERRTLGQILEVLVNAQRTIALPFDIEFVAACDQETVVVLRRAALASDPARHSGAAVPSHELGGV